MKIINLSANDFSSACCYLLESNKHGIIVDPGSPFPLLKYMLKNKYNDIIIDGILLTHGHFDHIFSLDEVHKYTNAPVYIHEFDNELLGDSMKNAYYAFFGTERSFGSADKLLQNGDIINLSEEQIKVIHTPGHTKGSVCFLCGKDLLTGDTLFAEGYGRCDFYGGDFEEIYKSINQKLRTLPSDITIYPGHGYSCKLSEALENLPF